MGTIIVKDKEYELDCVVFDKDGTLIDLDAYWGPRVKRWVETIAAALSLGEVFIHELYSQIGYCDSKNIILLESPLATASLDTLYTIAGNVIAKYGRSPQAARQLAVACAQETINGNFAPDEIVPKGNVAQVWKQLYEADIKIAVVTSDDRSTAEKTLAHLGLIQMVSALVCGDDPIPNKPSPEGAHIISEKLKISPTKMMMVGDSHIDMEFASNAKIAFRIAIAAETGNLSLLSELSDEVVNSIEEFEIRNL